VVSCFGFLFFFLALSLVFVCSVFFPVFLTAHGTLIKCSCTNADKFSSRGAAHPALLAARGIFLFMHLIDIF
jgi:hypothetical protein